MTHYDYISKMHTIRKTHPLTTIQQCLYHELVHINFTKRGAVEFSFSSTRMCKLLHISKRTLIDARKKLLEVGLIHFTTQGGGKKGIYSLTKTGAKVEHRGCNECTGGGASDAPLHITKYISINRNKNSVFFIDEKGREIEKEFRATFEEFRTLYPGIKRGLTTELNTLILAHEDFPEVLPLLTVAIQKQIKWYNRRINDGLPATPFPALKTWLNERRWENELPKR